MHELSSSAAAPPTLSPEPPRTDAPGDRLLLEGLDLPAAILDESGVVMEVNEAWRTSPAQVATIGQRYLDGLLAISPSDAEALARSLDGTSQASGDVRLGFGSCAADGVVPARTGPLRCVAGVMRPLRWISASRMRMRVGVKGVP